MKHPPRDRLVRAGRAGVGEGGQPALGLVLMPGDSVVPRSQVSVPLETGRAVITVPCFIVVVVCFTSWIWPCGCFDLGKTLDYQNV